MERVELYDVNDVLNLTKINNSQYFEMVALSSTKVPGRLNLLRNGLLLGGYGYNARRNFLRNGLPGCDLYYEVKSVPESAKLRKDLALSKTIVDFDENGIGDIVEKKYFVLYPIDGLTKEERKQIQALKITPTCDIWVSESDHGVEFAYEKSKDILARSGKLLSAGEVLKIQQSDVKDLLMPNVDTFMQTGNVIRRITLEEALDTTVSYYPNDEIEVSPSKLDAQKVETFYEYDPRADKEYYGEIYELNNMGEDSNGVTIWKKTPKIIQNENDEQYVSRALKKEVRMVQLIDPVKDPDVFRKIEEAGKSDHLVSFTVLEDLGKDYLIENGAMNKNLDDDVIIKF